jgi:hypothetical protein
MERTGTTTRAWGWAAAALLALGLSACGESDTVNPTPQPTPTPTPAHADVVMTLEAVRVAFGEAPGFSNAIVCNMRLNERAGVATTIDYLRLDYFNPDGSLLERTQLAGSQIPGGTQLAARGVRDFPGLALGFNQDLVKGRYIVISESTTDATGFNQINKSGQLIIG